MECPQLLGQSADGICGMSGVAHRLVLIRHDSNEWNLVLHSHIGEQWLGKGYLIPTVLIAREWVLGKLLNR